MSFRLAHYLSLIKFSHSIFALPFALMALLVAAEGRPSWRTLLWVLGCMISARAAAMAYNRLVDRHLDALNPRTAQREIPAGIISTPAALAFTLICSAAFLFCAWMLSWTCFYMALPVLCILLGYSHAKRFTAWAHAWLGLALGLAPPAAWVAVTGVLDASLLAPVVLGLGVLAWVLGFDILYACQDEDFDRQQHLHSIPVRWGRNGALWFSRFAHLAAVILFWMFAILAGLGWVYDLGVALVAVVLVVEHRLISPRDLSRINMAFFTMNGVVSLLMLACTALDLYT